MLANITDTLDGCEYFACKFDRRVEWKLSIPVICVIDILKGGLLSTNAHSHISKLYLKKYYPERSKLMSHKHKPVNNSGIPQRETEYIAQCILPDIIAFYKSEEGQREFQERKA